MYSVKYCNLSFVNVCIDSNVAKMIYYYIIDKIYLASCVCVALQHVCVTEVMTQF